MKLPYSNKSESINQSILSAPKYSTTEQNIVKAHYLFYDTESVKFSADCFLIFKTNFWQTA